MINRLRGYNITVAVHLNPLIWGLDFERTSFYVQVHAGPFSILVLF